MNYDLKSHIGASLIRTRGTLQVKVNSSKRLKTSLDTSQSFESNQVILTSINRALVYLDPTGSINQITYDPILAAPFPPGQERT